MLQSKPLYQSKYCKSIQSLLSLNVFERSNKSISLKINQNIVISIITVYILSAITVTIYLSIQLKENNVIAIAGSEKDPEKEKKNLYCTHAGSNPWEYGYYLSPGKYPKEQHVMGQ
jgi:hypothetical protein